MLELHVLLSGHRHLCFMDLYASALPPTQDRTLGL